MKALQVGDKVLTGNHQCETVYAFGHNAAEHRATDFLKVKTKDGNYFEVTAEHLVYVEGIVNPVRADALKVDNVLQGAFGSDSKGRVVSDIRTVQKDSLIAPFTASGTLLVGNGMVKASCYISLQDKAPEHVELQGGVEMKAISQHAFVHMALTPFRLMCRSIFSNHLCQAYNEDGMPHYVAGGIGLVKWLEGLPLPLVLQSILVSAFVLAGGILMAIEAIIFSPSMHLLFGFAVVMAFGTVVMRIHFHFYAKKAKKVD